MSRCVTELQMTAEAALAGSNHADFVAPGSGAAILSRP